MLDSNFCVNAEKHFLDFKGAIWRLCVMRRVKNHLAMIFCTNTHTEREYCTPEICLDVLYWECYAVQADQPCKQATNQQRTFIFSIKCNIWFLASFYALFGIAFIHAIAMRFDIKSIELLKCSYELRAQNGLTTLYLSIVTYTYTDRKTHAHAQHDTIWWFRFLMLFGKWCVDFP